MAVCIVIMETSCEGLIRIRVTCINLSVFVPCLYFSKLSQDRIHTRKNKISTEIVATILDQMVKCQIGQ